MSNRLLALAALLLAPALHGAAHAGQPPASPAVPDYMRYAEDEHSARLEVAIRSFTLPSGQRVDLVGVVHIADEDYYEALNKRFDGYDAVLFELVGDPRRLTSTPPAVLRRQSETQYNGMLTTVQQAMGRHLKLTFQLGAIDYTKKNMVHADTTAEEFTRLQQERGENLLTLFARAMSAQLASPAVNELNTFALIRILLSPDSAAEFKKALARVFDQSESVMALMEVNGGSAILTGRNDVAVSKLQEVLANRRQRRVAVFYGSGHMAGIEATLVGEMKAKVAGEEWLAAWTMPR